MRTPTAVLLIGLLFAAPAVCAAERHWQTGTWREIDVKRKMLDFGPGSTSFDGGGRGTPTMRAMADVRTFVIETDDLRLELEDVVPIGRRSIDATVGESATFALEKNTVYVRDADGKEHKLRVTKKTRKPVD
jgi:hypothetical protein